LVEWLRGSAIFLSPLGALRAIYSQLLLES
jgi:hypothetical protein